MKKSAQNISMQSSRNKWRRLVNVIFVPNLSILLYLPFIKVKLNFLASIAKKFSLTWYKKFYRLGIHKYNGLLQSITSTKSFKIIVCVKPHALSLDNVFEHKTIIIMNMNNKFNISYNQNLFKVSSENLVC